MWIAGNVVDAAPERGVAGWVGERAVWMVDAAAERWRVVSDETGCRLLVAGDCYASSAELRAGLDAVRCNDWRALTLWPGSYWVIADDGTTHAVLTDVCGSRPVYFTPWQGTMAWATKARPLAELVGAPLDLMAVVARMTCPTVPEVTGTETTYERVQRLPGGHALTIATGRLATVTPYEKERPSASFGEAAQNLRSALAMATTRRAWGVERVSADFSGGLDSTSLALLAARSGKKVLAATRDDPVSGNDDITYAKRAAEHRNVEHLVVTNGENGLFFDRLLEGPRTDQPFSDATRWSMRSVLHQRVLEAGTDLHLTGSGGDAVLTAPSTYLADLVRPTWLPILTRHASARARLRQWSTSKVIKEAIRLSRVDQRQGLLQLADTIANAHADDDMKRTFSLSWYTPLAVAGWLSHDARQELVGRARLEGEKQEPGRTALSVRRSWDELREFGTYQAELTAQLRATGIPAHAPMLDNAVVRACMSVAPHQLQSIAIQKPLLEAALRDCVPEFILRRPTKGSYDGNAYTGVRRNIATLRSLLDNSVLADYGLLDRATAKRHLARIAAGAPGRFASLEALIATEVWLQTEAAGRNHATWRRTPVSSHA
ncbi:albusnodin/ikarugamycin family macrolactam cyclase [Kribbella sp. NPDC056345]|uniref:albusnodin/ikarugamycin family macrolactam cyclase n=1 Tax=Kribbella sp. NPDC056345 TaxID=3345789 RepID=UPI0035E0F202